VIPGSLTVDPFHTLRMIAFPVFALAAAIPALEWFLAGERKASFALDPKLLALGIILAFTGMEAGSFHYKYYKMGANRRASFDVTYKEVYDRAVAEPMRPIYLQDGYWGPMYIHSLWYATLEGRSLNEFVHLPVHGKAPANTLVISSEKACTNCELIARSGAFLLYRQMADRPPPARMPSVPARTGR